VCVCVCVFVFVCVCCGGPGGFQYCYICLELVFTNDFVIDIVGPRN
jgi:hypothetical protein